MKREDNSFFEEEYHLWPGRVPACDASGIVAFRDAGMTEILQSA